MLKGYESDHAMTVWAMHVMLLCLLAYCGCIEHRALFGIYYMTLWQLWQHSCNWQD